MKQRKTKPVKRSPKKDNPNRKQTFTIDGRRDRLAVTFAPAF